MQAVWSACESCMCACLAIRRLGCDTKRVQRAQRARCRARPPSSPRRYHERSLLCKTNARSILQRCKIFARGLQWGPEATRLRSRFAVAHHAECVPCRAEERREASRALRRFFLGKAKRFVCESCTICRCNASVVYSDFRSIDGREPMPG